MRSLFIILFSWSLLLPREMRQSSLPGVEHPSLLHPSLVDKFYHTRSQSLFWFLPGEGARMLRQQLMDCIDSAAWQGLDSNRYHLALLRTGDSLKLMEWDRIYTDAAIAFCKDLYQGAGVNDLVSYDGISPVYAAADDEFVLKGLADIGNVARLKTWIDSLEPSTPEYKLLRTALRETLMVPTSMPPGRLLRQSDTGMQLSTTMNVYRWIRHFRSKRFIVVNIPSVMLRYFENDSLKMSMRVVAGQASKRTPRFAAWCNEVILYPYWNVPRKIITRELLPVFKKTPQAIDLLNMQILDGGGKIIDPSGLSWSTYNGNNFPYRVRQATGCGNALGVIKFNLTSPYDVYMHDTNLKTAFSLSYRYLSHGCIRLERPLELGEALMNNKLDTAILRSCLKDQHPFPMSLDTPVPVFVVYLTAGVDTANKIQFYKDVYHLLK